MREPRRMVDRDLLTSWLRRNIWRPVDIEGDVPENYLRNPREYRTLMYRILNKAGFNVYIYVVASLGFLASSYSLFGTSLIWPALTYVYPQSIPSNLRSSIDSRIPSPDVGTTIDMVTLGGNILGMIVFGHLSDRVGRKRLYGLELTIIVLATCGIIFSSNGYEYNNNGVTESTFNIFQSIIVWRFLLGVGIGAEYPMSAIIAAEYVSNQHRATMMSAVFLMQSIGRILAFGFGSAFLKGQMSSYGLDPNSTDCNDTDYFWKLNIVIDQTWRFSAGFGGCFAILAIIMRLTIPESPRYHPQIGIVVRQSMVREGALDSDHDDSSSMATSDSGEHEVTTKWFVATLRYLSIWENLEPFLAICTIWFLLDVCFFGTGLDSPTTLNILWLTSDPQRSDMSNLHTIFPLNCTQTDSRISTTQVSTAIPTSTSLPYQIDPHDRGQTIFDIILHDNARVILSTSIASLIGSLVATVLVNYIPRRKLLLYTSGLLAICFFIIGGIVLREFGEKGLRASVAFFAIAQFLFNIGPNTVVFILVAEIFPTPFRGTLYGLAAASGKTGALLIRPFVQAASTAAGNPSTPDSSMDSHKSPQPLGGMMLAFGVGMLIIALLAWKSRISNVQWKPNEPDPDDESERSETQRTWRYRDKNLEAIAKDLEIGDLCSNKGSTRNLFQLRRRRRDIDVDHSVENGNGQRDTTVIENGGHGTSR